MTSIHFKRENLLPCNKYIEDCEFVPTESFSSYFVDQVVESTGNLFQDICSKTRLNSVTDRQLVRKNKLDDKSITKAKLVEWLETALYLLDTCAIPLLEKASTKVEKTEQLLDDKIDNQQLIIDLQQKLLKQQEEGLKSMETLVQNTVQDELKSVQTTVKSEIKSYSAVLSSGSRSPAISEKKILSAIKSATEKEERNKNIIIYGADESETEVLQDKVSDILLEIGEKPAVKDTCRIGIKKNASIRPIKVTLNSSDVVTQILRRAKMLRTKEGFKSVYLCPDRTLEEKLAYKKLLQELKLKSEAEPDKSFVIRNNKIVSVLVNSQSVPVTDT